MRLFSTLLISTVFAVPMIAAACGGSSADADPYDTFQLCFDDHHVMEGLTVEHTITVCCLDHPIGGQAAGVVCGADAAACSVFVTANLTGTSATATEIMTACTDYQTQKGP